MTRMEIVQSGRIRFDPTKKGDHSLPHGDAGLQQRAKTLLNEKTPPRWLRPVCIVGATQAQIVRELGKQVTRMRPHDTMHNGEQLQFVEVEPVEA